MKIGEKPSNAGTSLAGESPAARLNNQEIGLEQVLFDSRVNKIDRIISFLQHAFMTPTTGEIANAINEDVNSTRRLLRILRHKGRIDCVHARGDLVWWITTLDAIRWRPPKDATHP